MSEVVHLEFDPCTLTDAGREAVASAVFDLPDLIDKIKRRALEGYDTLRVHQHVAVSLVDTDACGRLLEWLARRPYVVRWREARLVEGAEVGDGYVELVIGWGRQRQNTAKWTRAADEYAAWQGRRSQLKVVAR